MAKRIIFIFITVIVVAIIGLLMWTVTYPDPGKKMTPAGYPRHYSFYLTMRDNVDIAVEVWFPPDLQSDEEIPALVYGTRYSRRYLASEMKFKRKLMLRLGLMDRRFGDYMRLTPEVIWANNAGYAVALVDARGSAASFGNRPIEWSPDEVADYGEVIQWVSEQPWSNGRVGSWGTSYPGNTADLMASTGQAAFRATAPRFSDFDPLIGVGMPGGIHTIGFLDQWSELNASIDHDIENANPVDSDKNGEPT